MTRMSHLPSHISSERGDAARRARPIYDVALASHGARVALLVALACGIGCGPPQRAPALDESGALKGPFHGDFSMGDGFEERTYTLHLPSSYDGSAPAPVVFLFHGGGGNKVNGLRVTCPEGRDDDPQCLAQLADQQGFVVVAPDGSSGALFDGFRTWNAGGGVGDLQCVSGPACQNDVDELEFFEALLGEVKRAVAIDDARIHLTGISNGAALAHKLACERSTVIASIAPVAGGNQFAFAQGCDTSRPIPVLQIHGSADPCWAFAGGADACLQDDDKVKVSIEDTVAFWAEQNGCIGEPLVEALDDTDPSDEATTQRTTFTECFGSGAVELLLTENGGHTWPGGNQYANEGGVGVVTRDYSASDAMLRFFSEHPLVPGTE